MMDFWEVLQRMEDGPMMAVGEFDRLVSRTADDCRRKFDIRFDPDDPAPDDPALADRLFAASLEMFTQVGVFCLETRRVCRFSRDEVLQALAKAPSSVSFGSGPDRRTLRHRGVDDATAPFCSPNPVGTPVRQELYDDVARSYAQIPRADTFSGPSLLSLHGRPVASGSPMEVEAAVWNVQHIQLAREAVGRPGMASHNIIACAEKTGAMTAAMRSEFGVGAGDGMLNGAIAELKVDYERLRKIAFLLRSGHRIGALYGPLMGGYAGGPEGTAIVLGAHYFLGLIVFQAQWHDSFPIHIHQVCNSVSPLLWVVAAVGQAMARNTHLPLMTSCFTAAGPCTPMIFDELCAHTLVAVASGHNINPMAPARNKHPERCTGFEAQICCDLGHHVARSGLSLKEVNRIVCRLRADYEPRIGDAPLGKTFAECYDTASMSPRPEYMRHYEAALARWNAAGLPTLGLTKK